MSFLDTLFIDGTDIRALDNLLIGPGSIVNFFAPGERRGSNDAPGGRDGELGAELPLAAFVIEIPVRIVGSSRGDRNDNIFSIVQLIGGAAGNGLVQLKRRRATGGSGYVEGLAKGQYVTGLSPTVVNPFTGASTLQYRNTSGGWDEGSGVHTYP